MTLKRALKVQNGNMQLHGLSFGESTLYSHENNLTRSTRTSSQAALQHEAACKSTKRAEIKYVHCAGLCSFHMLLSWWLNVTRFHFNQVLSPFLRRDCAICRLCVFYTEKHNSVRCDHCLRLKLIILCYDKLAQTRFLFYRLSKFLLAWSSNSLVHSL